VLVLLMKKPINPIAVGQVGAFFETPIDDEQLTMSPAIKTKRETSRRAGTVLDHRWTHKINVGKRHHGLYDESKRVYQTGGDLDKFVFWKMQLVTLDYQAWIQVVEKTDWIEIIDHQRNECWRIPMARARKRAVRYEAGAGRRIGIPIKHWDLYTAKGTCKQKGES
jgi:hypothetical protein